ncbi:SpvB/TcaC N-terminal domain-containing protein [Longitalea luteola]|uniref:SpvB/TcaC N-terminal domain-containing protein n=1 Tax=Longitalea luteola TaxID=2812563 RepID=UPI001A9688D6|nr:SpvB/TcaC N-terminal domain-containing protein [Longitalea luteola]
MSDTPLYKDKQSGANHAWSTPSAQQSNDNTAKDKNDSFAQAPQITLPKGGGAIKGIDEKFQVNAVNGTAGVSIPLPVSEARGLAPSLQINYNSGGGNGLFGMGWQLGMGSVKRKTERELPQYLDDIESDTFLWSDSDDLVPEYKKDNAGHFITDSNGDYVPNVYDHTLGGVTYRVKRYRPRIEGAFARIEKWADTSTGYTHWRVISSGNVTTLYGKTAAARIADPLNDQRIFEWLPEFTYDDKGKCILYEYKPEDAAGLDPVKLHNANRTNGNAAFTNTYLKRVWYGNAAPYNSQGAVFPATGEFFFETVFDYGEHDPGNIPFNETGAWLFRSDAFSQYRAGFEVRTCRLCQRVLLYHHFDQLPGGSALIRALSLHYDNNGQDGFSFLKQAVMTGYTKHDNNVYTQQSTPPHTFEYQAHSWNSNVNTITPDEAGGLPAGFDDSKYLFIDLYNEGVTGMLTEQANTWFYKNNLGEGRFAPAVPVLAKPSFSGLAASLQVMELEANGTKQVVNWQGGMKGFFELQDNEEWQPFTAFESIPNINLNDANTRLIDLNGDGLADVLITEDEVLTWYPSKGKKGYEPSKRVTRSNDEEKGPALVFADIEQTVFLADMSGDGLQDIVRIRNGSVCYWPNLGYGRFGAKVNMDHAPLFDVDDQFAPSRIQLADIDGSGTTDIIYLSANQCAIWLNHQGNAFGKAPVVIDGFPDNNQFNKVNVLDLLGTGLSCIVWSSPLPANSALPLKYIDLMSSKKPHILIGYKNNMGKEIELEYQPSTKYYLADKQAGRPWVTKLHFPVHCISKVIVYDRIMKTRFASEYVYHHGYYDHYEKEFRGFGRVDQQDSEDITHFILQGGSNTTIEQDLHQPPVLTKTWFHTGAFVDGETILNQYAHEYYQNTAVPEKLLPEPELPSSFTVAECIEALRACKGKLLRKEIYALDGSVDADKPYTAEQHNCGIRLLQPAGNNKYAVFLTHARESITYHYERNPADPRVMHALVFETDYFGNVLQSATVVYPRKTDPLPAAEQVQLHITYTKNRFTNAVPEILEQRTPALHDTSTFEVTGVTTPASYFELEDLYSDCLNAGVIDYEVTPDGSLQKRLIELVRTQYRGNDGVTALPFGVLESKGLVHQASKAAFNNTLLSNIFSAKITLPALTTLLTDPVRGGYVFADNYFWITSGTTNYDTAHFYLPTRFTDQFGNNTLLQYDAHFLFPQQLTDALNNVTRVEQFNYRVLRPAVVKDANDNLSAVRFDESGRVVSSFVIGKPGIDAGDEFDTTKTELLGANDFPGVIMQYNVSSWYDQTQLSGFDINNYKPQPNYVRTRTRETHYHAHLLHQTKWHESYEYSSGSGNVVLTKAQAEPGAALQVNADGTVTPIPDTFPNLRWIGNGRTIVNNKGNAVKQYEPYFSTAPSYDDEKEMVQLGVTPVMHYDPINRVVRTDLPNKTFTRVEFTAWQQTNFDPNDTVRNSEWYISLGSPNPLDPEPANPAVRAAWLAAKHHNTPAIQHLDSLGRVFLKITTDGTVNIENKNVLDIEGNIIRVTDGLNRPVIQHRYGMLGNSLQQTSIDAGSRWTINDAAGKQLLSYNDRGCAFTTSYDALQRPVALYVEESDTSTLFSKSEYGEDLPAATAKANNLRQKVHIQYDQSGVTNNLQFDFKGNLLRSSQQMARDYVNTINWTVVSSVDLEPEVFESSNEFDALNRVIRSVNPHVAASPQTTFIPSYNEAGLLEKVDVTIRGAATATPFITNVHYNAKGQREEIFYGNGTKTTYTYEKETFRLVRLLTTRNSGATVLQDLHYTFDAVGNITELRDAAQADVSFDGELVKALNKYEYDAVYRLKKASGRKHAGQTDTSHSGAGTTPNYRDHPFIRSGTINPNDAQAFRNYIEQFGYDQADNMLWQQHTAKDSSWTRTFEYDNGNNLNNHLTATTLGGDTFNYTYDAHGNMAGLETLSGETWNFLDQFKAAGLGGGGSAHYVYNAGGQRVRKVIERLDGSRKERLYLGAVEIYREYNGANAIVLERETVHVLDDQKRIAMIDTPVVKPNGSNETQLIRYQYDYHLGSASIELDDLAQLISYEEYFPFGATSYTSVDATREVAAKRYRYTGKERDEESGLNYHGARYYALWLCRWTTADPAGMVDGPNLYRYCRNNPIKLNDPNGMDPPKDPPVEVTPLITDVGPTGVSGSFQFHNLFSSDRSVSGRGILGVQGRSSFLLDVPPLNIHTSGLLDVNATAAVDTSLGRAGVFATGGLVLGTPGDGFSLVASGEGRLRFPVPSEIPLSNFQGTLLSGLPQAQGDFRMHGDVRAGGFTLGEFTGRGTLDAGRFTSRLDATTFFNLGRLRLDAAGSIGANGQLRLDSANAELEAGVPGLGVEARASGTGNPDGSLSVTASADVRLLTYHPLHIQGSGTVSSSGASFAGTFSGPGPLYTSYITGGFNLSTSQGNTAHAGVFGLTYTPSVSLTPPAIPGMPAVRPTGPGGEITPWNPGGLTIGASLFQYNHGAFNYISGGFMPDLGSNMFTNPRFGITGQISF